MPTLLLGAPGQRLSSPDKYPGASAVRQAPPQLCTAHTRLLPGQGQEPADLGQRRFLHLGERGLGSGFPEPQFPHLKNGNS